MTKEADYAVRIVYCITKNNQRIDAKNIAEQTSVSLRFSLKILRKLAVSGIVKSYKGKNGGYELAKKPQDISLGDVIRIVDGPYILSRCLHSDTVCDMEVSENCGFRKIYSDISKEITEKLDDVTFQSISEMI